MLLSANHRLINPLQFHDVDVSLVNLNRDQEIAMREFGKAQRRCLVLIVTSTQHGI